MLNQLISYINLFDNNNTSYENNKINIIWYPEVSITLHSIKYLIKRKLLQNIYYCLLVHLHLKRIKDYVFFVLKLIYIYINSQGPIFCCFFLIK